jgi:nucleoside-diphosphate-sugar epimerase
MVTINELAQMVMKIAGKRLTIHHIPGPQGVRGRKSDNCLIWESLAWKPSRPLGEGLEKTYFWLAGEMERSRLVELPHQS